LFSRVLAGCESADEHAITGYVEAIYLRPAAAIGGRITTMTVDRGDTVTQGQTLFSLDAENEQAAVDEAKARLDAQSARLADLEKGRRPEELAVIRAQLQQAQAQKKLSTATARRQTELARRQLVSAEVLDTARTTQARDEARVAELKRELDVAELAGRSDALEASRQEVATARAHLGQAQWALSQKSVSAPAAGSVEDVYFRAGEWVGSGVPVLALLPPANKRLRFFVPQSRLGEFVVGVSVRAHCDGCGEAVIATVRFVAAQAEFAPPVLFDRHQRARLVYRVEALASAQDAVRLHPGQPVDIQRVAGDGG
jgi:HlyD family secretion protein